MKKGVFRQDILSFAAENFDTVAEYLWLDSPDAAVLRHPNGKWYGIVMSVGRNKLGFDSSEIVDILVCKSEPMLRELLMSNHGFLPAYHMNKQHWITVLLDGSVDKELAFNALDASFQIIGSGKSARRHKRDF